MPRRQPTWGRIKPPPGTLLDWSDPINAQLQSCWSLGEGAGTVVIDSTGYNGGVLTGTAPWSPSPQLFGERPKFNGSTGYVLFNRIPTNLVGSVSFWFYGIANPNTQYDLLAIGGSNAPAFPGRWELRTAGGTGKLVILQRNDSASSGTVNTVSGSTVLAISTWYHIVVTGNGTTWTIYVNGKPEALTPSGGGNSGTWFGGTTITAPSKFVLATAYFNGAFQLYANAFFENLRHYSRVLSANDAWRLYAEPFAGFYKQSSARRYSFVRNSPVTITGTTSFIAMSTSVTVEMVGGGQAGAGNGGVSLGGVGGAGAYDCNGVISGLTIGNIYTVVIGAGGSSSGAAGGDSTFNTNSIVAPGGGSATTPIGTNQNAGGAGGSSATAGGGGGGGSGGTSSIGNAGSPDSGVTGGAGGAAVTGGGAGGAGGNTGANGVAGGAPGGAGGGAGAGIGTFGAGAVGQGVFTWGAAASVVWKVGPGVQNPGDVWLVSM